MRKTRGFRLGNKLVKVFKWAIQRRKKPTTYPQIKPMSKLCNWGRSLKHGARGVLCFSRSNSGYIRVGQDPVEAVPKGYLAVYVGEREDNTQHRYLVPVIYFNHPLFGDLLRVAEEEFGFDHSGGIQIPCRISEFENLQKRIAATGGGDRRWRQGWRL